MGLLATLATAFGVIIYLLSRAASALIAHVFHGGRDQKKWQLRGKYAVLFGVPVLLFIGFDHALDPGDEFHLKRFSLITLRNPPNSARVVAKSYSSGLHSGESCAYARIEVQQQDYADLLASIAADPKFIPGTKRHTEIVEGKLVIYEESKVLETGLQTEVWRPARYIPEKTSFVRPIPDEHLKHYSLIFLSDGKHIDLNSCT